MAKVDVDWEKAVKELRCLDPSYSQCSVGPSNAAVEDLQGECLRLATFSRRQLSRNPWLEYQPTHLWTEYLLNDTVTDLLSDYAILSTVSDEHLISLSQLVLKYLPLRQKKRPFQLILPELLKRNFDWSEFAQDLIKNLLNEPEIAIEPQIIESVIKVHPSAIENYLLSLQWQFSKLSPSFHHLLSSSPFLLEKSCLWVREQYLKYPESEPITQFASSLFLEIRSMHSLSFLYPVEAQPLILYADLVSVMPPTLREAQEKLILCEYLKLGQNDARVFLLQFPELSNLIPVF